MAVLPGSDCYLPATHLGVRVASVDYDDEAVLKAWDGRPEDRVEAARVLFPQLVAGCDDLECFLGDLAPT